MAVLIVGAMPFRVYGSFPVVNSISILDILLLLAAFTLMLDLAFRPLDTGYRGLFLILSVPLIVSVISLAWSQDRPATLRSALIYFEGLIAFLFVVRELEGLSPTRVMNYLRWFAYLLIIPAILLLLHVPGFAPQELGLSETSGTYASYYTRLSHPILGRSNNLATVLAFLAPLLLYWGYSRRDRRFTRAGYVVLLAILLTLSRGVILALLIGGAAYLLFVRSQRMSSGGLAGKIAVAAGLGAVAIGVFYTVNPSTHEYFQDRLTLANVTGRQDVLSEGFGKVSSRPILGFGAGVTPDEDTTLEAGVHNTYLQQALAFGLPVGLLVSLALCAIVGVFLARRRFTPLAEVIGYTIIVQLVIFAFESSFEGTVLRVLFYLSVGLAVGLLRSVEAESRTAVGPAP
jgi:O-antigen ligase